jgi:hypothetical protein
MTLHEAILQVLHDHKRGMNALDLAEEINRRQLYSRRDGNPLEPGQVSARINRYPSLFNRDGDIYTPAQ